MKKRKLPTILLSIILASVFLSGCSSSDFSKTNKIVEKPSTVIKNSESKSKEGTTTNSDKKTSASTNVAISENKQLIPATISKNVDGDTIDINLNGIVEKVRMLCVDTPETHHPRLGVQPFGPEASEYTKKILAVGTKVQIEPAIGGGRDKYGRLLAYIYINGKMFNEMLLEQGLARVAYIYAPNTKYVDEFYALQKVAQKKGIGIWSIEDYAKDDGYHPDATKRMEQSQSLNKSSDSAISSSGNNFQNNPSDDQESNLNCKGKIKGNANSHVFHVQGGAYYDSTKDNIVWFCTEKEAEDAGYRKSKR
jgi:micrococcal nuclease